MVRCGPSVTIELSVLNSSFPSMGPFQAFASRVSWFMFEVGGFITFGRGTVHRTIFRNTAESYTIRKQRRLRDTYFLPYPA